MSLDGPNGARKVHHNGMVLAWGVVLEANVFEASARVSMHGCFQPHPTRRLPKLK